MKRSLKRDTVRLKSVIADLCLSFCFLVVCVLVSFPLYLCLSALVRIQRRAFTHCQFSCGGGKEALFFPLAAQCRCCVCRADGCEATVCLPRGVEPAIHEACEAEEGGYETHRQTERCDPAGAGLREEKLWHGWSQRTARQADGRNKFDSSVTCRKRARAATGVTHIFLLFTAVTNFGRPSLCFHHPYLPFLKGTLWFVRVQSVIFYFFIYFSAIGCVS